MFDACLQECNHDVKLLILGLIIMRNKIQNLLTCLGLILYSVVTKMHFERINWFGIIKHEEHMNNDRLLCDLGLRASLRNGMKCVLMWLECKIQRPLIYIYI